jgi:hypothetical protein
MKRWPTEPVAPNTPSNQNVSLIPRQQSELSTNRTSSWESRESCLRMLSRPCLFNWYMLRRESSGNTSMTRIGQHCPKIRPMTRQGNCPPRRYRCLSTHERYGVEPGSSPIQALYLCYMFLRSTPLCLLQFQPMCRYILSLYVLYR